MEKEAKDALLLEVKNQVSDLLKEGQIDKKGFEELSLAVKALEKKEAIDLKEYNTLKDEHIKLMADFKALQEAPGSKKKVTVEGMLGEKAEDLKSLKNKKGESIQLEVKAAGTITTGNVTAIGTGGISSILTEIDNSLTLFPRSQPFIRELFPSAGTTSKTIAYAEMKNPDGGAGMTAEGAAKSQYDFDIVEAKTDVKKITAYIKTSKEALDDIPALAGEINNELLTIVNLKADSQILTGDGTGQNLLGIMNIATTFAAGDFALAVEAANEYDVLNVAIAQIQTAEVITGEPAGFMPNYIVMNPIDVKKMKLTKDANDNYVFPVSGIDITRVDNIPVIENARMTKGSFLVMDSTKGNVRIRENATIDIGYENDDFTKNLVTILAEMRLAFYAKSQYTKAFVKGVFATAKTALETAA